MSGWEDPVALMIAIVCIIGGGALYQEIRSWWRNRK